MNEVMPVDEELDNPCPRIPKITKVEENTGEESSKPCLNLTLSVRFRHKYNDQRFSNSSCAECKYKLKKLFPTYY